MARRQVRGQDENNVLAVFHFHATLSHIDAPIFD